MFILFLLFLPLALLSMEDCNNNNAVSHQLTEIQQAEWAEKAASALRIFKARILAEVNLPSSDKEKIFKGVEASLPNLSKAVSHFKDEKKLKAAQSDVKALQLLLKGQKINAQKVDSEPAQ